MKAIVNTYNETAAGERGATNKKNNYLQPDMKTTLKIICCLPAVFAGLSSTVLAQKETFPWPEGKRMALSLSFDDARITNVNGGTALLDKYDVKATFYVVPSNVERELAGWKKAAANGHEMGNHSIQHPCSGNFPWSRGRALETYTIAQMREELEAANRQIKELLGVTPTTYAYPCGLTTIGRGAYAQSFVPLIADMFVAGRGWRDEAPVDPSYCDMALLTGMEMDGKDFEEILPLVQQVEKAGQWLVLAGHETAASGNQTTRLAMLEKLVQYAQDPDNGIWIAPVGTIAAYVREKREQGLVNTPQPVYMQPGKEVVLPAQYGSGKGPKIEYMPEWKAFGWFTGKDLVEWDLDVAQTGRYQVFLDWSVSDEEAGKGFVLEAAGKTITGKVDKSGSWETFKEKKIGELDVTQGRHKLVFRPATEFGEGALLDLRTIRLVPVK